MAGRIRLSFHTRVVLTVLAICWMLVGTFMVFQYHREKEFKTHLLDTELQMFNARILSDLARGESMDSIMARVGAPVDSLRVTLVDRDGRVVYDNNDLTPFPTANHNTRPEIVAARAQGIGHAAERHSESDDAIYFYSARLAADGSGMVVRSAAAYTHSLEEFLRADSSMLWIMGALTLVMSLVAQMAMSKISLSISRLNSFAARAEKGERIFGDDAFPDDELGSIASHIVRLYVQRDQQHREAMRQEQDKIRLKKQLTNNINHELKTPVASMLVCLDLLRDHPELPEERKREFLDRIHANASRLSSLLKDVAAITRMDEGASLIEKEPVNLSALIHGIAEEERMRTTMKICVDVPAGLTVEGNRGLLESVFRNLIDNAIAYSGGSHITVRADRGGNITVADDGSGIPEEHLPHIFERFYRIDKGRSREAGGTGLGLAIVRNAIAIHGGTVKAVNDGGLRFDIHLPPAQSTSPS